MKFTIQLRSPVVIVREHEGVSRFCVTIHTRAEHKIPAIRALRTACGYTLKYAKDLVCDATLPVLATAALSEMEARTLIIELNEAGCVARMERAAP